MPLLKYGVQSIHFINYNVLNFREEGWGSREKVINSIIDKIEVGLVSDKWDWRKLIFIRIGRAISFILICISSNIINGKRVVNKGIQLLLSIFLMRQKKLKSLERFSRKLVNF